MSIDGTAMPVIEELVEEIPISIGSENSKNETPKTSCDNLKEAKEIVEVSETVENRNQSGERRPSQNSENEVDTNTSVNLIENEEVCLNPAI